jgi:hypothetical protein
MQLKKQKDAVLFLQPVDPIALNIPHFSTIITNPLLTFPPFSFRKNKNYYPAMFAGILQLFG